MGKLRSKLQSFRALSPFERRCLAFSWLGLLLADLALRFDGFAGARKWLRAAARSLSAQPPIPPEPGRLARLVSIAAEHHLYEMTCLRRSLVAEALLHAFDIPVSLEIGVSPGRATGFAHAWVELDGCPLGEPVDIKERFFPLQGMPRPLRPCREKG